MDFSTFNAEKLEPVTGGWSVALPDVRYNLRRYTEKAKRGDIWVGIASDGERGCEARWNDKYKPLGMNHMVILYTTLSDSFRKETEKSLVELIGGDLANVNNGGGGPTGSPPYVVYCAWKE